MWRLRWGLGRVTTRKVRTRLRLALFAIFSFAGRPVWFGDLGGEGGPVTALAPNLIHRVERSPRSDRIADLQRTATTRALERTGGVSNERSDLLCFVP